MNITELTPLVQLNNPYDRSPFAVQENNDYTGLTYEDIRPKNLQEIINTPINFDRTLGWTPCQRQDDNDKIKLAYECASWNYILSTVPSVAGLVSIFSNPPLGFTLLGVGAPCTLSGIAFSLYGCHRYAKIKYGLGARFDAALREADGNLAERVNDWAIVEFFPTLSLELYHKLDLDHTLSIYAKEDLRNLFRANSLYLNANVFQFWSFVFAIQEVSKEKFRKWWPDPEIQKELLSIDKRLPDVIVEYLPANLKSVVKKLEQVASTSQPSQSSAEPQLMNLDLTDEQEERLGNLHKVIESKNITVSAYELAPIYSTALEFGLEPLLRSTYLQGVRPDDLYSLLLCADDIEWFDLKKGLLAKIISCIAKINTLQYDYEIDPFHLRHLHAYAEQTKEMDLKRTIIGLFIVAFEDQFESYKNFKFVEGTNSASLFSRYVNLEILQPYLNEPTRASFQKEIQHQMNEDVKDRNKRRILNEGYQAIHSINNISSMFERAYLRALTAESVMEGV